MVEIIFDICISVAFFALAMVFSLHVKSERHSAEEAMKQRTALALELAEVKKQLDELDPQGGVDAVALEKAFNEGVERIMNYSLTTAMGGGMNG